MRIISKIIIAVFLSLNLLLFNNDCFAQDNTYVKYKVCEKDTFYKISETFNIPIEKLMQANDNIKAENLKIGEVIKIPANLYKLESSLSIEDVAKMFDTSVETIVELNDLITPKLYEGDFINIVKGYDINNKNSSIVNVENNPFKTFMFKSKEDYEGLYNSYDAVRTWTPSGTTVRGHEGIDIMSDYGTPIYAVADGVIARYGWNMYGGWRINIKLDNAPYYTYYAHMSSYAKGIYLGKHVVTGELIGYVGDTGYGPEGTSGKFAPHLHFGLYDLNMNSLSPFDYLVDLESKYFK